MYILKYVFFNIYIVWNYSSSRTWLTISIKIFLSNDIYYKMYIYGHVHCPAGGCVTFPSQGFHCLMLRASLYSLFACSATSSICPLLKILSTLVMSCSLFKTLLLNCRPNYVNHTYLLLKATVMSERYQFRRRYRYYNFFCLTFIVYTVSPQNGSSE